MKCFWFSGIPSLHAAHSSRVSKPNLKRLVRSVSWPVRRRATATSSFIVMPIIPVRAQGYTAKSGHLVVMFVLVVYQLRRALRCLRRDFGGGVDIDGDGMLLEGCHVNGHTVGRSGSSLHTEHSVHGSHRCCRPGLEAG